MKTNLLEHALKLPLPERVNLADEIYRSINRETSDEPIPRALLAKMERRDQEYEVNPAAGCTVDEMEMELFKPN